MGFCPENVILALVLACRGSAQNTSEPLFGKEGAGEILWRIDLFKKSPFAKGGRCRKGFPTSWNDRWYKKYIFSQCSALVALLRLVYNHIIRILYCYCTIVSGNIRQDDPVFNGDEFL